MLKTSNHTQINNEFLDIHMRSLSGAATKCFLAISRKTIGYHKETDFISLSQLQGLTGLSNNSVIKAIEELIDKDLVIKERSKMCNKYTLNYLHSEVNEDHTSKSAHQLPQKVHSATSKSSYTKEINKENIKEKENKETHLLDFDRWWDEYPKKVGRKPALDKWVSLSKKKLLPSIEEHIGIIKKMKASKQWDNKAYIPNPSTWLNQERWNDEIPTYEVPAKPTSGIGRDEIDEIMGGGNHG